MTLPELEFSEQDALEALFKYLREKDQTFSKTEPLRIPNTDYILFFEANQEKNKVFKAFFKICSGSITNMVIFLEAAYREVNVREKSGETKLIGYKLMELIENQIALPDKLTAQLKDGKQVDSRDRRQHVVEATKILEKLKSLPR
jgi:hypothetical protein